MTTVILQSTAAAGEGFTSRPERKTHVPRVHDQGDYCPSPNWAPETTTDPQHQGKDHLPFDRPTQPQQQQQARIPADEPFTVQSNSGGGDLPSWWGQRGEARATAAVATRRPSSPFQSAGGAFQQQEHPRSSSWSESPALQQASAAGITYNGSGSGQMMAKAGYMPFDNEDRLGIFDSKRGGFDQQASTAAEDDWRGGGGQQHSPAGSGVSIAPAAAASGLDAWPSTYSTEIGESWTRQAEGGAQQSLRQVCARACAYHRA